MSRTARQFVYFAIDSERDYQNNKIVMTYGALPGPAKTLESYALYIADYSRELTTQLSRVWGPDCYPQALATVRKIAALAVAAMEEFGAPQR